MRSRRIKSNFSVLTQKNASSPVGATVTSKCSLSRPSFRALATFCSSSTTRILIDSHQWPSILLRPSLKALSNHGNPVDGHRRIANTHRGFPGFPVGTDSTHHGHVKSLLV